MTFSHLLWNRCQLMIMGYKDIGLLFFLFHLYLFFFSFLIFNNWFRIFSLVLFYIFLYTL